MPDAKNSRPGASIDHRNPKQKKHPKGLPVDVVMEADPFVTPKKDKKKDKKKGKGRGMLQVNRNMTDNEWATIARSVGQTRSNRPSSAHFGRPRIGGGYRPTRSRGPLGFRRR